MSDLMKSVRDYVGAKRVRIDGTAVAGIFKLRDPWLPKRVVEADREKVEFLNRLLRRFPACFIWLDSRFDDLVAASDSACTMSGPNGSWCGWFVADRDLLELVAASPEGGWACVFFSKQLGREVMPVSPLPFDPRGIETLRNKMGAEVMIVSEIDDEFWLLSLTENALTDPE